MSTFAWMILVLGFLIGFPAGYLASRPIHAAIEEFRRTRRNW